ncbi:MAG: hypothetical protein UY92_C0002G0074 [Candidatus Magasanikbacteria bacterium GW2011_GWA2_56_11]|uniref:UBA/THIF-type NAD/FAD binding protein n=1 Tax=Candidatus Magasanikbacteria bacterium GW2011_GWA2_56_11 TaxID=1619044 RepID=A0A0G2ANN2_9BACT|nr:MAG: hypothetical protein UY92_C0002G0074 [Candidatus Magasanikbacteria bacterium GW2011_GWA2_56_11]
MIPHPRLTRKPFVVPAKIAHERSLVAYRADGAAVVTFEDGQALVIPRERQYDLIPATLFGLNERLTLSATSPVIDETGRTLREAFNDEWERYNEILATAVGPVHDYGYYAVYGARGELVRYAPPEWHRLVAVASSSTLLGDPEGKLNWQEVRRVFETTVVAVAGASVGSTVAHNAIMDMRPRALKIADKSVYKMENMNRVRIGYADMVLPRSEVKHEFDPGLRNKALAVAEQVYAIDPYIDIFVYAEGISAGTVGTFFAGGEGEPPADVLVEEVDDPRIKLLLREEARRRRLPVVMVTDAGSAVQLDILRYDLEAGLPLTYGTSDEELYARMEAVYDNPGNREIFFNFVEALVGADYRQGEMAGILAGKREVPTSTIIPQLGSTAAMAGAVAAEAVARLRLGASYPPRVYINKANFKVSVYQ